MIIGMFSIFKLLNNNELLIDNCQNYSRKTFLIMLDPFTIKTFIDTKLLNFGHSNSGILISLMFADILFSDHFNCKYFFHPINHFYLNINNKEIH